MKKYLFFLVSLLLCQLANAQESSVDNQSKCAESAQGVIFYKDRLVRYSTNTPKPKRIALTRQETYQVIDCYDNNLASRYKHYCTIHSVGKGLTIGGGACAMGGFLTMLCNIRYGEDEDYVNKHAFNAGVGLSLAGLGVVAVGIPLQVSSKHKVKQTVREFSSIYLNNTSSYEEADHNDPCKLSLNGSARGLGVTFTF